MKGKRNGYHFTLGERLEPWPRKNTILTTFENEQRHKITWGEHLVK